MTAVNSPETSTPRRKPIRIGPGEKALNSRWRMLQRYLMPATVSSLLIYLRDRALVSPASRVQFTRRVRLGRGSVVMTPSCPVPGRPALGPGSNSRVAVGDSWAVDC